MISGPFDINSLRFCPRWSFNPGRTRDLHQDSGVHAMRRCSLSVGVFFWPVPLENNGCEPNSSGFINHDVPTPQRSKHRSFSRHDMAPLNQLRRFLGRLLQSTLLASVILLGTYRLTAAAQTSSQTSAEAQFNETLLPILTQHCSSCHAGASPANGLSVQSLANVLKVASMVRQSPQAMLARVY